MILILGKSEPLYLTDNSEQVKFDAIRDI